MKKRIVLIFSGVFAMAALAVNGDESNTGVSVNKRAPQSKAWRKPLLEQKTDEEIKDWVMVCQPDTQILAAANLMGFRAQTAWIAKNAKEKNIKHVFHLGDMVDEPNVPAQWSNAINAMSLLNPILPTVAMSLTIGNHDFDTIYDANSSTSKWASAFGHPYRKPYPWYRGSSNAADINDDRNHYCIFSAGGREFLSMDIQCSPRMSDLEWADKILKQYPDMPTIVGSHAYLDDRNGGVMRKEGKFLWNNLIKKHPQIFMVVNGHYSVAGSGSRYHVSKNKAGLPVIQMLADYQSEPNSVAWFRLVTFEMSQNRIRFQAYNPCTNSYITGPRQDYTIDLNFAKRFALQVDETAKDAKKNGKKQAEATRAN